MQLTDVADGLIVREGETVVVTSGEYDDYTIMGLYRANRELDVTTLLRNYPTIEDRKTYNESLFLKKLIEENYLTNVSHVELYLGDGYKCEAEIRRQGREDSDAHNTTM